MVTDACCSCCIVYVFFQSPYLVYHPSLEMGVADGFYDMVDGLIGDIFRQSSKINRLAKQSNQEHYQVSFSASDQLLCGRLRVISAVFAY